MSFAADGKRRRKAENFSAAESFGLFMEALRDLQFYTEYSAAEDPDTAKLNQNLADALESLEKCHKEFPLDLLPQYYLAIALTMQNQRLFAREVEKLNLNEEPKYNMLAPRPWPLLDRAASLFQSVVNCGPRALAEAATFNLAHVYAKRDGVGDLEKALSLLDSTPKLRTRSENPSFLTRFLDMVQRRDAENEDARFRAYREDVAQNVQARTLRYSIEARIASRANDEVGFSRAIAGLTAVRSEIESSSDLSVDQQHDLLADSWTKSGFLAYGRSVERRMDLGEAEKDLTTALQYKSYWIPAQTYLAIVKQTQGKRDEASALLRFALGRPSERQ